MRMRVFWVIVGVLIVFSGYEFSMGDRLSSGSDAVGEELKGPYVRVGVDGMVCSFCAQGIKEGFVEIRSVQTVVVDMDAACVNVYLKQGHVLKKSEIIRVIDYAGYTVRDIWEGPVE